MVWMPRAVVWAGAVVLTFVLRPWGLARRRSRNTWWRPRVADRFNPPQQNHIGEDADHQGDAGDQKSAVERTRGADDKTGDDWCDGAHQIVDEIHDAADRRGAALGCNQRWDRPDDRRRGGKSPERNRNPRDR